MAPMMSAANDIPPTVESAAFDAATAAVAAALAAGARYADARLVDRRHEGLTARDGDLRSLTQTTSAGLGVRALVGSSWGFAALGDPAGDADARATGARATAIAHASAAVAGAPRAPATPPAPPPVAAPPVDLVGVPAVQGSWASECLEDPFAVPLAEK